MRRKSVLAFVVVVAATACAAPDDSARWWKGNLHTHTLWSDGDDYPEMVLDWYREAGYDFVALSDHNVLARSERWIQPAASAGGLPAFEAYLRRFGPDWVERRDDSTGSWVRLKRFDEFAPRFDAPGEFLVIEAEEITDGFDGRPIHVNATNVAEYIAPRGGTSAAEVLQNNVDAVLEQRERTQRPMFPHVNHPNFGWALDVEDLIPLRGERFFEVYNGHPQVHNEGDSLRPSTERMWDILLAERRSDGADLMFGVAVDDAHHYGEFGPTRVNPGRAWVMVRAVDLTAAEVVAAMEAGDFYGSTGVALDDVRIDADAMTVRIRPAPDVQYRTLFIGTRAGYDRTPEPLPAVDRASVRYRYSDEIGVVLAEVEGTTARYAFSGDELYVRAKVISSRLKDNPYRAGERESAWVQPVTPDRR